MEKTVLDLRADQMKTEKQKDEMRDKLKYWKTKADTLESEKTFLYN